MTKRSWTTGIGALALAGFSAAIVPGRADAFCGFYVSGADTKLFNNATMVVMMRDGTRTVLSMQNNYEGPPESFAIVVPVPVVLQKENVKTLPREVFTRVDQLAAPRLVEYWEQDPCAEDAPGAEGKAMAAPSPASAAEAKREDAGYGVKVEAQFAVGEYEVVVLSANDSSGLDRWLHDNNYKIPDGAAPVLKPYVEANMKFFVAKVDTTKVKFEKRDGRDMAMLSPLRFYYDTDTFSLPVRLGLLNSNGKQDLIVHILARSKRYEVANYPNVTIPTNLDVSEATRNEFGAFYASLFDKTLESMPSGVVTEYAWGANGCDPCPTPGLSPSELATLGADVIGTSNGSGPRTPQITFLPIEGEPTAARMLGAAQGTVQSCYQRALETDPKVAGKAIFHVETDAKGDVANDKATGDLPATLLNCARGAIDTVRFQGSSKRKFDVAVEMKSVEAPPVIPWDFVLTRLHARYGKESLAQDLIFREAKPILGGREVYGQAQRLEYGATESSVNNFQARYAIRHPWKGDIKCSHPVRGRWGGPPANETSVGVRPATDLAFATRGSELTKFLRQDVPELKISGLGPGGIAGLLSGSDAKPSSPSAGPSPSPSSSAPPSACSCDVGSSSEPLAGLAVTGVVLSLARRRKRARR